MKPKSFILRHSRQTPQKSSDIPKHKYSRHTKGKMRLTSVFSHGGQLRELPSSSAGHGGTGGAGLHGAAARMRPT